MLAYTFSGSSVGVASNLDRSLLPGVARATMLVKPILYLVGSTVSCMWLSCSSVNPDRNRHFPGREENHVSQGRLQLHVQLVAKG